MNFMLEKYEVAPALSWLTAAAILAVGAASTFLYPASTGLLCMCAATVLVVFLRPRLGVWLVIAATPLEMIGPLSFSTSKAVKLCLTALVSLALFASYWRERSQGKDPYRWPLLLIFLAGIPASLLARSPLTSLSGVVSVLLFVLWYKMIRHSRVLVEDGPRLLRMLLVAGVLSSLLCAVQLTHGYSGPLASAEQQAMESEQAYFTMWPSIWRSSAAFNGPNAAGAFLTIGALIGWSHALLFRKFRLRYWLAGLVCWLGVLSTFSRGALLGSIAGCIFSSWVMGWWSRRRWIAFASIAAMAIAFVSFNDDVKLFFRLGGDLVSASPERVDAWQASVVMLKRNPVFGIGIRQFHDVSQGIIRTSDTPQHPHNGFLKLLVEEGPVGGLGYLLLLACFARASKRSLCGVADRQSQWVLAVIAGAGASLFTQELFDAGFTIGGSSVAILFATLLGLQTSLSTNDGAAAMAITGNNRPDLLFD